MASVGLKFAGVLAAATWAGGCTLDFDSAFAQPQAMRDASFDNGSAGTGGSAGDAGKDTSADQANGGADSGKGGMSGTGGSAGGAACASGDKRCNLQVPQSCTSAGQWQDGAPCTYVCLAGACSGNCVPGTVQCNGLIPQSCDASGVWQSGAPCANVCSAGICVNACTDGTKQCSGTDAQSCVNGVWQSAGACPYVCAAGSCSGICTPGAKQCAEQVAQSCDATGQWQSAPPCQYVCAAGDCTGVCAPGSTQCSGQTTQACDATGQWQPGMACLTNKVCCGGACVDPTNDPNNCAACGNACNLVNASAVCVGGLCAINTCQVNYGDCNADPTDGCEVNLQTDVLHCGVCNRACSAFHVASKSCTAGACDSTCALGYANCVQPPAALADDGCERNVASNDTSCGGCGNNCLSQGAALQCGLKSGQPNQCICGSSMDCELGMANGQCNPDGLCTCDGASCVSGEACKELGTKSVCTCNGGAACASGETCCQTPSGCKALMTDRDNCGACGRSCAAGFVCSNRTCACSLDADCNAGSSGSCLAGVCQCGANVCAPEQRCLSGGLCG
jgi:hypothetical protein